MSKHAHFDHSAAKEAVELHPKRRTLEEIVRDDGSFPLNAYLLVFQALDYTGKLYGKNRLSGDEGERHVTGQQLLEGVRRMAVEEFGYLAKTVFEQLNVLTTADIGRIVFFLVEHRLMGKTDHDCMEDFIDQYDFSRAFDEDFTFAVEDDVDLSMPSPYFHRQS